MQKIPGVIVCFIIFSSCTGITGSGRIKTEERMVGHFDGIQSAGSVDIEVKIGPTQRVEIEGDDNVLKYVLTEVSNGLLTVRNKSHIRLINSHLKAFVTTPVLNRIYVTGSSDIQSRDTLRDATGIELNVGGSGDIKAIVHTPTVTSNVTGSGSITLQGVTRNFDLTITGSGEVKSRELMSENAVVRVSGSGSAHVYASMKLDASVTGSGDIFYSGNPTSPSISKSGSGSIQKER